MRLVRMAVLLGMVGGCWPGMPAQQVAPIKSAVGGQRIELREGWRVGSSCAQPLNGEVVSAAVFDTRAWYPATVPATVLAVQLANDAFRKELAADRGDLFFGMNLRKLPGMSYPVGTFFANMDMAAESPYKCGWWYRRPFMAKKSAAARTWLHFAGINYRGNVWVNGTRIADATQVAGAYRTYDFDVTDVLTASGENVVAVETFAPNANDLGINWVDWNPAPPDKDMGLWGAVTLETRGVVSVRAPMVTTHFENDELTLANLQVTAELENSSDRMVAGVVRAELGGLGAPLTVEQPVTLGAHEHRTLTLSPDQHAQLRVEHPPIWWPVDWGAHPLETVRVEFRASDSVTDEATARFGIREMSSQLDASNHLLFKVNRKPILIRGGGWSPDMLLRVSPERMKDEIAMVLDLHFNTLRLEGKLETDEFFDLADQSGLLVMAGWCCCDHWEHWTKWTAADEEIAVASLRAQMLRLRSHASMLVWLNGSDGPPPEQIERHYLAVEREARWPNALLSSAASNVTLPTGPSGVKMLGPYDYVVPSYWLRDQQKAGGAYGFNTETSPGPAIPTVAELRRFLPEEQLWPQNATWDFHTGGGKYKSLAVINRAMEAIYGPAEDVTRYTRMAQAMAYDSERAMFEAYARNKYQSTGVIQWMLNNAWPSLIWHLYDYYLQPGAGYYGAKKACEPLHVQFSYDDNSVVVVNSTQQETGPLTVLAEAYDLQMKPTFSRSMVTTAGRDAAQRLFTVPAEALMGTGAGGGVAFVALEMRDAAEKVISRNFYWLPVKQTLFDWPNTDYTHTPPATFEDLTALRTLPAAKVRAEALRGAGGWKDGDVRVRLTNVSSVLAFQVSMEALTAKGKAGPAVVWSDSYLALRPGEVREVTGRVLGSAGRWNGDGGTVLHVSGWNVADTVVPQR